MNAASAYKSPSFDIVSTKKGIVSRGWEANKEEIWDQARESGVNILTTDLVRRTIHFMCFFSLVFVLHRFMVLISLLLVTAVLFATVNSRLNMTRGARLPLRLMRRRFLPTLVWLKCTKATAKMICGTATARFRLRKERLFGKTGLGFDHCITHVSFISLSALNMIKVFSQMLR